MVSLWNSENCYKGHETHQRKLRAHKCFIYIALRYQAGRFNCNNGGLICHGLRWFCRILTPASKMEIARKKQRYQPTNRDNASFYQLLAVASILNVICLISSLIRHM
jgi:hypothetical protein